MKFSELWPSALAALAITAAFVFVAVNMTVAAGAVALIAAGVLLYKRDNTEQSLKKYWPIVALIFVVLLSAHLRLLDYRWPYLRNIDSYTFYRQMNMIVDTGILPTTDPLFFRSPYEQEIANSSLSSFSFSPIWYFREPYVYFGAFSYMLVRSFTGIELWQYLIYLSPFLAAMSSIFMYYVGKSLYGRKAGILAALFFTLDISNFSRSLGGDPGHDAFIMLVESATLAFYFIMYKRVEDTGKIDKLSLAYGALGGVLLALFQNVWAGYWFIPWLVAGFLLARTAIVIVRVNVKQALKSTGRQFLAFGLLMAVYLLVNAPFFGTDHIYSTLYGPFEYGNLRSENTRAFPNVYVSVAELQQPGDVVSIISRTAGGVGGPVLWFSPFMLTCYALIYFAYAYYKRRENLDDLLILSLWMIGPIIATLVAGVRFTELLSAPVAVGSGMLLSRIYEYCAERGNK